MGKIGSIFHDARLGKGLTLDQVADETNISKRFLQSIENDSFDGFPGEVYTLGFIRNYADFLGLDSRKMIELYHSVETPPQTSPEPGEAQEAPPLSVTTEEPQSIEPVPAQPSPEGKVQTASLFEEENVAPPAEEGPSRKKPQPRKRPQKKEPKQDVPVTAQSQETASQGEDQSVAHIPTTRMKVKQSAEEKSPEPKSPAETKAPVMPQGISRFSRETIAHTQVGRFIPLALVVIVMIIAAVSILPLLKIHHKSTRDPAEYRVEGLPYEQRLYPQDKVFLPLGTDFVSVTLSSIKDTVTFDTPFGPLSAGLNEEVVINPSSERERLTASILDYAPNEPQNGVRVKFDFKAALSSSDQPGDITIAADTQKDQSAQATSAQPGEVKNTPEVLFRSSGAAHPFYVNVNFMAPVFFRYEADKKEWVEKYYKKGESITINASNSITFWTANAQAVKVNVFQSAGKSKELVMGGAGEIAVKRLFWSNAQGGWAVVAESLD